MAVRPRRLHATQSRRERRQLHFERLEDRRLLSLSHLYTFNDGLANDWIGSAHATLFGGATIAGGQLVLANGAATSGASGVQHLRLGTNVLPSGDATIEVWFTAANLPAGARLFDIGTQVAGVGEANISLVPDYGTANSLAQLRPAGASELALSGVELDDGLEHMAALAIDTAAGLFRLYIDGAEIGTTPLDGATAGSVNDAIAFVGRSLTNADPAFTGSINELRIYDNAQTADEIAASATAGPSTLIKSPLVRQMEYLDRGTVVVRRSSTEAYVGWRLLGTDPAGIAFNVYRGTVNTTPIKLNSTPITQTTNFVDTAATGLNLAQVNTYYVVPVVDGVEGPIGKPFDLAANSPVQIYLNVPLQIPAGGTTPSGESYTYSANDVSVGDVDGDGEYEYIVKWEPSNAKDNSQSGYTGNVYVDAYKLDGTRLWRIDLGRNIRAGAHYTQFMVYDLDGDGRAEVAMKTAPGTIDGQGQFVLLPGDNAAADYRNSSGYVLAGPEYLTVFSGLTGAELDTVPYVVPRHPTTQNPTGAQLNEIWGDSYGNRVDRFLAGIGYFDGERPSLVMARGYYTRSTVAAWDFRNGQLVQRWLFDTSGGRGGLPTYTGQGAHSLSIADVDNDGRDEVIYGAMAIDDTGAPLYSTGLGHGDALHVSDMDPNRPGLEVFMPHEGTAGNGHIGASLRDARTGAIIAALPVTQNSDGTWPDVGRGVAMDIDPNHAGYEFWDSYHGSIYNAQGVAIYNKPGNMHTNFGVWWDADLLRETLDGTTISDWNYTSRSRSNYDLNPAQSGTQSAPNASSNNGSKSNPALSADLFGDWREEVVWRRSDNTALEIFTTAIVATNRLFTLMHDSQYREAIAWQNVAYNQPPHPSFFLGAGMATPPAPQIYTVQYAPPIAGDYNGDRAVDAADYTLWRDTLGSTGDLRADGDGDEVIGPGDYEVWRQHYGMQGGGPIVHTGGGSTSTSSLSTTSIPLSSTFAALSTWLVQPNDSAAGNSARPTLDFNRLAHSMNAAVPTQSDSVELVFALLDATSPVDSSSPIECDEIEDSSPTEAPQAHSAVWNSWTKFDLPLRRFGPSAT